MELTVVPIVKPDAANFIFGQSHFIKTVEDLHEALVGAVPAFASGWPFARPPVSGWCAGRVMTKPMLALARDNALAIGAGHTFLIFLGRRSFSRQRAGCGARGTRGLPHLLRDGQPGHR